MSTATLGWVDPTTRVDGSMATPPDVANIEVYDAVDGGTVTKIAVVPSAAGGPPTTFTTGILAAGTHVFTVDAVDTFGTVSAMSVAASVTVPMTKPAALSPPTDLTAVLNP